MTEYLRAAKNEPSSKLATGLFYAIKTDTDNFVRPTVDLDMIAFRYLYDYANMNIITTEAVVVDQPTEGGGPGGAVRSCALSETEVETLFGIMRELKHNGLGVIFISHRLKEVMEIADRVIVLADGNLRHDAYLSETSRDEILQRLSEVE